MTKRVILFLFIASVGLVSLAQITNREAEAIRITQMGDVYLKEGIYDQAIYHYQVAYKAYPGYVRAQFQLAQCFRLALQLDSATTHYEAIIAQEQDARYPIVRYHLAMIQLDRNQYQPARENLVAFRNLLSEYQLQDLKRYRDFYKQAQLELDQISSR